jgi:hypothetical protein
MPYADPHEERTAARDRKRRQRKREKGTPAAAPLSLPLRTKTDVLATLEVASSLAGNEPYAARTLAMIAKTASGSYATGSRGKIYALRKPPSNRSCCAPRSRKLQPARL